MKKIIIRIVAIALLAGGLAFNFGLSNTNSNNELVSLDLIANIPVAQAEIDPFQACVQYCWPAPNYYCTLWVTGTGIYIDCYDRYPY